MMKPGSGEGVNDFRLLNNLPGIKVFRDFSRHIYPVVSIFGRWNRPVPHPFCGNIPPANRRLPAQPYVPTICVSMHSGRGFVFLRIPALPAAGFPVYKSKLSLKSAVNFLASSPCPFKKPSDRNRSAASCQRVLFFSFINTSLGYIIIYSINPLNFQFFLCFLSSSN